MMDARVKPLEWHHYDAWTWWAESVCGTYTVEERNGSWKAELRFRDAVHIIYEIDDFETAMTAAQTDCSARIIAALVPAAPSPAPQCCMCGKKDLSTVEGNGGTECELSDGRWVCSSDCWDKATGEADLAPALGAAAMREMALAMPTHKDLLAEAVKLKEVAALIAVLKAVAADVEAADGYPVSLMLNWRDDLNTAIAALDARHE